MKLTSRELLSLKDGEKAFIELQHDEIAGGHIDVMNLTIPRAIALLLADDAGIELSTKRNPFGIALSIDYLAVIEIGVMPMAEGLVFGCDFMQGLAAVGEHFWDMLTVVVARIIESG